MFKGIYRLGIANYPQTHRTENRPRIRMPDLTFFPYDPIEPGHYICRIIIVVGFILFIFSWLDAELKFKVIPFQRPDAL